jgi:Secretion system C-terminal sorting domain
MKCRVILHSIAGLLCSCFWFILIPSLSNAQANINGIINSYYKVTSINTTQSSLNLPSTAGLSLFDNVMLIQMKGAAVNTTNTASFGSISAYNDAGNYELNVICGIEPTRIYLQNKISKTYDPTNGFVQVVKVATYSNATVTSNLEAQTWDKNTGTGGVLAVIVNGTLTLQSNVSATDNGFRGGDFKQLNGLCGTFLPYPDYFYNTAAITTTTGNGGNYKGEGIAELINTYSGGRGASANAGGGGNDHNNGGGGGGNLTTGGRGGNNTSTVGCRGNFPGVGAYSLSNAGNKIFMGGGGGMGHGNGTAINTDIGNGGGIIFIKAVNLIGNGYTISANGSLGTSTIGDGAGGGGAAGTIIMAVSAYSGSVIAEAYGGNGGAEDNLTIAGRLYGTGGGGGGGVIYYTGAVPLTATNNVAGGAAGIAFNSNPVSGNGNTGATAGANGTVNANYTVSISNTPETYCNLLLSSKYIALSLNTNSNGNNLLKWKLQGFGTSYFSVEKSADGLTWEDLGKINFQPDLTMYTFKDETLNTAPVYYRIKAVVPSGLKYYSNVVNAKTSGSSNKWLIVGNPVKDYLYINGLPQEPVSIVLYDAAGKQIMQFSSSAFTQPMQVNVSNLSKGVYYVRCNGMVKGFLKQ